jgi:hypothetical protein
MLDTIKHGELVVGCHTSGHIQVTSGDQVAFACSLS